MSRLNTYTVPHDANRLPATMGVSKATPSKVLPVTIDDTTGGVIVSSSVSTLVPFSYDYIGYTNTNTTTDQYVYKSGGSGGTTVATVTIVYTDTTKTQPSTVTRT
jgi:hypothetical protein